MRLFRACGSARLGQVTSDFAARRLWLGNRKVRSQVVGEDLRQFPGRRTVGQVRRGVTQN